MIRVIPSLAYRGFDFLDAAIRLDVPFAAFVPEAVADVFPDPPEDGEWSPDGDPTGATIPTVGGIASHIIPDDPTGTIPAVLTSPWHDLAGLVNRRVFSYIETGLGTECYDVGSQNWVRLTVEVENNGTPGEAEQLLTKTSTGAGGQSTSQSGVCSAVGSMSVTAQWGNAPAGHVNGIFTLPSPLVNCVVPPLGNRGIWRSNTRTAAWSTVGGSTQRIRLVAEVYRACTIGRLGFGWGPG